MQAGEAASREPEQSVLSVYSITPANPPNKIFEVKRLIMASCIRLAGIFRGSHHLVQCRKFTSTTARRNDATSNLSTAVQKKPIGGFRGGYIIYRHHFLYINILLN